MTAIKARVMPQLHVGATAHLLAAFRHEEDHRGPSDAMAHLPNVDQRVRSKAIEMTSHSLRAELERLSQLRYGHLAMPAYLT